jgi:hypothetical protein
MSVSNSEEVSFSESSSSKSALLDLASLRTLEQIKAAFTELSNEEVTVKVWLKVCAPALEKSIEMFRHFKNDKSRIKKWISEPQNLAFFEIDLMLLDIY